MNSLPERRMLCTCVCVCAWQGRGLAHFYLLTAVGVAQSAAPMPENLCTNCVAYFLVLAKRLQVRAALSAVSTGKREEERNRV